MKGGITGMYVMEIPPGKALEPEKHMYEEIIYILKGRGAAEVWQEGKVKRSFEWEEGSLFSPPLNCWHKIYNGGREPALYLAVTDAPIVMNLFHSPEFVFGDSFLFRDRYDGEGDYFNVREKIDRGARVHKVWDTNFIPDLKAAADMLDDPLEGVKGAKVKIMNFEMAENVLTGHLSEWPVGMYHKAHYHGPGAILLGLRSNQHFNTGKGPARHIAFRTGGTKYKVGLGESGANEDATVTDIQKGGALIAHEDEDSAIHAQFEEALAKEGIRCAMGAYHPRCTQR
jgi:hypothetical protein